jgi:hypothetical protein
MFRRQPTFTDQTMLNRDTMCVFFKVTKIKVILNDWLYIFTELQISMRSSSYEKKFTNLKCLSITILRTR